MPILSDFSVPASPAAVAAPQDGAPVFIAFLSSRDPATNQPWCPDVRATLPTLENIFSTPGSPDVGFAWVGQIPEWRDSKNVFRTKWNVNNVPTLVRYQVVGGAVKETGRLVEGDILNGKKLQSLLSE